MVKNMEKIGSSQLDALSATFTQIPATPEAAKEFEKASHGFISMSLAKSLKDFKLKTSFKIVVKLDNTRRLARASATTTTTSTTTTYCESAASELLEARLRHFEA